MKDATVVMLILDESDPIPVGGYLMRGAIPIPGFQDHLPMRGDFFEMAGTAYEITSRTWAPGSGAILIRAESIAVSPKQVLQETIDEIDKFDRYCSEAEYTDTRNVWSLLNEIRENAHAALKTSPIGKIKVDWDTDGKPEKTLPGTLEVPAYLKYEEVADWLSEQYGWLVNGWESV